MPGTCQFQGRLEISGFEFGMVNEGKGKPGLHSTEMQSGHEEESERMEF
jgi:hypothetical protein